MRSMAATAAAATAGPATTPSDVEFPFTQDLQDVHLVYDYIVRDAEGKVEKWRYEIWFFGEVIMFS